MPTNNRRRFVVQSIRYFQRQSYLHCELIIVDDGQDAVADLLPDDPRIRYVFLNERLSIGAKRNIACAMSRGDLIAHWDDDDWIAPDRLAIQVDALLSNEVDVCGLRDLMYYQPASDNAWLYHYPAHERPWVAGGTLLYHRAAWDAHRFPDIDIGEDSALLNQLPAHSLYTIEDLSFYIGLIHPGNTGAKHLADRHWRPYPLEEVHSMLAQDRAFYTDFFAHSHQLMPQK